MDAYGRKPPPFKIRLHPSKRFFFQTLAPQVTANCYILKRISHRNESGSTFATRQWLEARGLSIMTSTGFESIANKAWILEQRIHADQDAGTNLISRFLHKAGVRGSYLLAGTDKPRDACHLELSHCSTPSIFSSWGAPQGPQQGKSCDLANPHELRMAEKAMNYWPVQVPSTCVLHAIGRR
ncbi:hypothetical protein L207DRAFT_105057 [Hyaloscypha variabilis F]|uniref:Uncharacterized protein n=1 Tax=Hyaloscypha variabilis (strain UAMH 11265 / GT02V1 / F) TaxID=1149755 RepID=A0A2J6RCN5_HYAVF|nr:hypothetical protein L207DRAFT_105057 [Hyaloscypha variabilis F]